MFGLKRGAYAIFVVIVVIRLDVDCDVFVEVKYCHPSSTEDQYGPSLRHFDYTGHKAESYVFQAQHRIRSSNRFLGRG